MKKITVESARQALKDAVALKGEDYVYTDKTPTGACRYFNEKGEPSCLVGHVYEAHEIDPRMPDDSGTPVARPQVEFLEGSEWGDGPWVGDALLRAQRVQDDGGTWGEAFEAFERTLSDE